ncbi:MAG: C40 family peptidase [Clostridium sp.]|nr:C40 family peptidase [Clostridium sp.]
METPFKILACLCSATVISVTAGFGAQAAINLETDSSVAGVSVAMNNYYAGSLDPENELAEAFSSDETMEQVVKSGKEDAPTVKNPSSSSAYDNVAVSQVSNYVNVRSEASTKSSVVGKIYNNCAATILDTVDGEGGKWYKIQSGSVNGYIKAQYFITGAEAEKKARQVGTTYAKVANTSTLRLREEPSLDSKTLDLLSSDAEYEVIEEKGDFYKVSVDTDLVGYVFKDYVDTRVEFDHAVTNSEEEQKAAEESKRKEEAEKALQELEEAKKEAAKETTAKETAAKQTAAKETTAKETVKEPETIKPKETEKAKETETSFSGTIEQNPDGSSRETTKAAETKPKETEKEKETTKAPETEKPKETQKPSSDNTSGGPGGSKNPGGSSSGVEKATRTAVVAYAKQFLGNPYVYGGTSLTKGADCSGFTQSVYAHFGISTGRSSRDQAARGKEIPVSEAQPGDMLFYASGSYINHVAMYIGGGQIIHSSNPKTGICIAPSNYRTPCKAVTFLD